jgi:anti-sigma factor RsiW
LHSFIIMLDLKQQEQLSAFIDGELSAEEAEAVKRLIGSNLEAQRHLEALEHSRALLASEASHPPPTWSSLQRKFARHHRPSRRWGLGLLLASGALGALFLLPRPLSVPTTSPVTASPTVDMVETDLQNSIPIVYLDQPSGWTVIWIIEEATSHGG